MGFKLLRLVYKLFPNKLTTHDKDDQTREEVKVGRDEIGRYRSDVHEPLRHGVIGHRVQMNTETSSYAGCTWNREKGLRIYIYEKIVANRPFYLILRYRYMLTN